MIERAKMCTWKQFEGILGVRIELKIGWVDLTGYITGIFHRVDQQNYLYIRDVQADAKNS